MPGKRCVHEKSPLKSCGSTPLGHPAARMRSGRRSGRKHCRRYLRRADAAGLSAPLPDDLDEQGLDALLFPPRPNAQPSARSPTGRRFARELKSTRRA